jgi:hypothetical protein
MEKQCFVVIDFLDEILLPVFRDGFYSEQWTIVFSRGKDGKVAALTVMNERLHDISFDKTSADSCKCS